MAFGKFSNGLTGGAFSSRNFDDLGRALAGGRLQQALVVVGHSVGAADGLEVPDADGVAGIWKSNSSHSDYAY